MPPSNSLSHPRSKTSDIRVKGWRVLLLGFVLACLPLAGAGCSNESTHWLHASALNDAEAGDLDGAIEKLKQAIEKTEDDDHLKLVLASVYARNEQADLGVCLCDEFLERYPDNKRAHRIRSVCLQYLGRFEEACETYQNAIDQSEEMGPTTLNNLAYFYCLARKDLPQAARYIQKAIDGQTDYYWGSRFPVKFRVRAAVALGLVSRHVDRRELAVVQLDKVIQEYQRIWELQESLIQQTAALQELPDFEFSERQAEAIDKEKVEAQRTRQSLGLLLMTRCLIREDQELYQEVDRDRLKLKELGFEFEELVANLPSDHACLDVLRESAMFLDTRGFIRARLSWQSEEVQKWAKKLKMNRAGLISSYQLALEDLDLAVTNAEVFHLALYSDLVNRYDTGIYRIERERKSSVRTIAVLRYHRSEAHRKAGNESLAVEDESRIKELGLEPDANLH